MAVAMEDSEVPICTNALQQPCVSEPEAEVDLDGDNITQASQDDDESESDSSVCEGSDIESDLDSNLESDLVDSIAESMPRPDVDDPFDAAMYEYGIAKQPLYNGAPVTVLEALAEMFDWFTSHPATSKESLSRVLHMQHHTYLPDGNLMPDNYRWVNFLVLIIIIHVHVFTDQHLLYSNHF